MPEPATKSATCSACQKPFSYAPKFFDGSEVFTPSDCPDCTEKENVFRERVAADRAKEERRIVFAKLGLPFTQPGTQTVISKLPSARSQTVLNWSYGPKGLFMHGDTGLGKTRTLIEVLRKQWVEFGHEFSLVKWADWQAKMDEAPKFGSRTHSKEVTPLLRVPLLALDDVLKGRPNESIATAFFQVIDTRTANGLPTLLTTKYGLSSSQDSPFEARLGIGSRDIAKDVVRRLRDFSFNAPFNPS